MSLQVRDNERMQPVPMDGAAMAPAESAFDLKKLLRLVRKHLWMILSLVALAGLLAGYYAIKAKPVYQARASLMVERPTRMASLEQLYGIMGVSWEFYPNQIAIMHSRAVAERVVKQLGLDASDAQTQPQLSWYRKLFASADDSVRQPLSAEARLNAAINRVKSTVIISQVQGSGVFNIMFDDFDPALAAMKANTLAEAYIDEVLESSIQQKQQLTRKLSQQLPELERKVRESEQALREFQTRNEIILSDTSEDAFITKLNSLDIRLSDLQAEKASLEPLYQRIVNMRGNAQMLSRVAALNNRAGVSENRLRLTQAQNKMNELAQVYGPKHPKMKAGSETLELAQSEYDQSLISASQLVVDEFRSLQQQISNLQSQSGSIKSDIKGSNDIKFELESLQRNYEYNKQIYDAFLKQSKESDAASSENVQAINARILNYATVPTSPYKPNKKMMVIGGAFAGLFLAMALVFLLEHLDNTFRSTEEIEARLGLPVIGLLPTVKADTSAGQLSPAMEFSSHSRSTFSEAIRTLRTGVLLASPDQDKRTILITSTVPGEGKTTIAINLAHALSHLGPTLLIEADLRRPAVNKNVQTAQAKTPRKPGLANYISGECKLKDCIESTKHEDFYQLLAGSVPANPLEIISSQKFDDMLSILQDKFKYIIMDCAPVLAVSDALVLAQKSDEVLFVLRHESTPSQLIMSAVKRLNRVRSKVAGVIVNRIRTGGGKYGRYYNYDGGYYTNYNYTREKA